MLFIGEVDVGSMRRRKTQWQGSTYGGFMPRRQGRYRFVVPGGTFRVRGISINRLVFRGQRSLTCDGTFVLRWTRWSTLALLRKTPYPITNTETSVATRSQAKPRGSQDSGISGCESDKFRDEWMLIKSAASQDCTFECTVWHACKAPSRVHCCSKLHPRVSPS